MQRDLCDAVERDHANLVIQSRAAAATAATASGGRNRAPAKSKQSPASAAAPLDPVPRLKDYLRRAETEMQKLNLVGPRGEFPGSSRLDV